MPSFIGIIAEKVPIVHPTDKCSTIYRLFEENLDIEGVIVAVQTKPVGLVMRIHFYQNLSKKYGFDLFMGRNIELMMDKQPLYVDFKTDLVDVSTLAMQRSLKYMYDYVIVTLNHKVYGIVSIKNLLLHLAKVKADMALDLNPLTGLPGNYEIQHQLEKTLSLNKFSILYLDLDQFKAYNDTYGFNKGDELLKGTATILKACITNATTGSFIGHIGGDDFITILSTHSYSSYCEQIIKNFDNMIKHFYRPEDYERGYIYAQNRRGHYENLPLVGISIAVITNKNDKFTSIDEISKAAAKIKKICKMNDKSCYYANENESIWEETL